MTLSMELEKIAKRPDVNPNEGEKKYGDVEYADPKNKKYPIDTAEHVRAALRYIGMPKNRSKYAADDLKTIVGRIHSAAHKFGIDTTEKSFDFSFFANVTKAYEGENGEIYLVGEASGPELDQDREKMGKSAIDCMVRDVDFGIVRDDGSLTNVPLNDAHVPDGVQKELGEIIEAKVTPDYHLEIKAKLHTDDNSAAMDLYKQLQKGKQYGLSVGGFINNADKKWDQESGTHVKTYLDVDLQEISVTSRPSWAQSYLEVMSKSIKDNNIYFDDNQMAIQDNLPESSEAEEKQETKNLVDETLDSETENAEVTEKAKKSPVTRRHAEAMRKKASHLHEHLAGLSRGDADPDVEMGHIADHAKELAGHLAKLAKGDTSTVDPILQNGTEENAYLALSEKEEEEKLVTKASDDDSEDDSEEDDNKEDDKKSSKKKASKKMNQDNSDDAEEDDDGEAEKAHASEVLTLQKSLEAKIEALEKQHTDEVASLRAELEVISKESVGPIGRSKKVELTKEAKERLGEEAELKGSIGVKKAQETNPNLDFKEAWKILNAK